MRALSFGAAAAAYQRGRPPYPAQALGWVVPATTRRILDLGVGIGAVQPPFAPLQHRTVEWCTDKIAMPYVTHCYRTHLC